MTAPTCIHCQYRESCRAYLHFEIQDDHAGYMDLYESMAQYCDKYMRESVTTKESA